MNACFPTRRMMWRSAGAAVMVGGLTASSLALTALLPSAATASRVRYPIHVVAIGSASSSTQQVVITGAFADAGQLAITGPQDTVTLSKGTIVLNLSAGAKAENKLFSHLSTITNSKTCATNGAYRSLVKIVSGTGANTGITGTIAMKTQELGVFPTSANGSCDLSSSATPVGFFSLAAGTGTSSYHQP